MLEEMVPQARLAACRELTKVHEEVLIGTPTDVRAQLSEPRGELTLVISGVAPPTQSRGLDIDRLVDAARRAGLTSRTTVELLRAAGVSRREAYEAVPSRDAGKVR
jgi:16S rRNA (cytidine1402-2'-O)-methyltransferase